uniref:Uncharacterized protein n=1 Tax=Parascaris univalens TaxID=6257 RepID=A0A914ZWS1_PARUN
MCGFGNNPTAYLNGIISTDPMRCQFTNPTGKQSYWCLSRFSRLKIIRKVKHIPKKKRGRSMIAYLFHIAESSFQECHFRLINTV